MTMLLDGATHKSRIYGVFLSLGYFLTQVFYPDIAKNTNIF